MHDKGKWDGLKIEWKERNYINPPYSRKLKEAFVRKAIAESKKGKFCVMLLPVSTSTDLFHNDILPNISYPIRFLKRRLKFVGTNTKGQRVNYPKAARTSEIIEYNREEIPLYVSNSGMHDSMIVCFGENDLTSE